MLLTFMASAISSEAAEEVAHVHCIRKLQPYILHLPTIGSTCDALHVIADSMRHCLSTLECYQIMDVPFPDGGTRANLHS